MKNLTDLIIKNIPCKGEFDYFIEHGASFVLHKYGNRHSLNLAEKAWAAMRAAYGFKAVPTPLLTAPADNMKLEKGAVPSYGITLQHYVQRFEHTKLVVNACPWAGDCTKVCVLDNGSGRYDTVQRARRAKTEFLATKPHHFAAILGYELAKATLKGEILLRPNVNSDVEWERIAPGLCNGEIDGLRGLYKMYGYSKNEAVLDGDGWLGSHYRVAYSLNEKGPTLHDPAIRKFLRRGGSVAVVTDRKPKTPIRQWMWMGGEPLISDADLTDEWMFEEGVIGDLSAKGKARKLIGESGFIECRYSPIVANA